MLEAVYASKFLRKVPEPRREFAIAAGLMAINDVYMPYMDSTERYQIYYGGRGSGKSRFIAQKLIRQCINHKYFKCMYVRKGRIDIKESMYDLLCKVIREHQLGHLFKLNESTLRITYSPGIGQPGHGNCFIAKGMDDPEKSKSIEELTCIWCEEVTELDEEDFNTANQNLRTMRAPLQTILSFNPVHVTHWVRKKFFTEDDSHKVRMEFGDIFALRTTLQANHFIDREQYAKDLTAGASGNANIIRVVLEGDWGLTENGNPWLHAFDMVKHIKPLPVLPTYPIYLTFDINADPLSCTAWQMTERKGGVGSFLHAIDEFGGHIKVEDMCQRIKAKYPAHILFVTGDRSGQNEDVGRNQTIYQIIQSLLGLKDSQMHLNTHNLEHADSRLLMNALFTHYTVCIDPKCKNLIDDCHKATVDPKSVKASQLQKDRADYKMDYFDGMRYLGQTYFNKYIKENYLKVLYGAGKRAA